MKKKRIIFFVVAAVILTAFLGIYSRSHKSTDFVMGSVLTQTWWGENNADWILDWLRKDEKTISEATEAPLLALEIMKASGGAFTPYLGALVRLWNIDGKDGSPPHIPTQEEIDEALKKREIDLGAYGKGAACDTVASISYGLRTRAAVINLGGNILTYGRKPWGQPFKIALRDPLGGPNDTIGVFTLKGTHFISTSGSYEKFFEQDGKRYHHIFDPETGYPAEREPGLVSVTVINDNGALGDMISTACFVLGYEESLPLLEQYNCDALFIYESGEIRPVGNVMQYWSAS